MIDLIIPYYNNPEGLQRTLDSINRDTFYVTIIDDSSTTFMPHNINADQVLRYNANHGPGFARQFGMDRTYKPYVMFIDTGDVFTTYEIQDTLLLIVEDDLYETDVFSFQYYHKNKLTNVTDNRMHGKIYKREFLLTHNITFCPESSYMDEDIGFNRTCRLLTNINFIDGLPVIVQVDEKDSITNKDNCAVLYRDQTRALSLTSIHTIEICRRNQVDYNIELNQIAISLYYWFLKTIIERPEFVQQAWEGAKIFYKKYENDINLNTLILGNPEIKKCLDLRKHLSFPINILRFAKEIMQSENIPTYYLT